MTTLEVLRGMRELLSEPSRWTKGTAARNSAGVDVSATSADAESFCMYGAAICFVGEDNAMVTQTVKALREFDRGLHRGAPSIWQDQPETTHAEVLALLDRAIASERAKVDGNG